MASGLLAGEGSSLAPLPFPFSNLGAFPASFSYHKNFPLFKTKKDLFLTSLGQKQRVFETASLIYDLIFYQR
jgi:hypothetical protein